MDMDYSNFFSCSAFIVLFSSKVQVLFQMEASYFSLSLSGQD